MTIIPIQVLRALAALSVAMLHGQHEAGLLAEQSGRSFAPSTVLPWAAGVDVFFVISGFVMVVSSRSLFEARQGRRVFLARRIARVVPLYWLLTTGYLALALAAPSLVNGAILDPAFVLASYLFVPLARPDGLVQPLYSLGWTLNYEMFFYGLFALALALPARAGVAALVLGLAALSCAGILVRPPEPLGSWTDPILLEFAAGLVLGLWRTEGVRLDRAPRLILAAVAATLFAFAARAEPVGIVRAVIWGIPAACLVAACGLAREGHPRPERTATRLASALGDASYALYLVHPFALRGTRELIRRAGVATVLDPVLFLLAGLAVTVLAAHLVHRLVERPLAKAARRALEPIRP